MQARLTREPDFLAGGGPSTTLLGGTEGGGERERGEGGRRIRNGKKFYPVFAPGTVEPTQVAMVESKQISPFLRTGFPTYPNKITEKFL